MKLVEIIVAVCVFALPYPLYREILKSLSLFQQKEEARPSCLLRSLTGAGVPGVLCVGILMIEPKMDFVEKVRAGRVQSQPVGRTPVELKAVTVYRSR